MGSLSLGWLVDTMDMIISFDPHARQTDVRPSQRAVCPLLDSLAYVLTVAAASVSGGSVNGQE